MKYIFFVLYLLSVIKTIYAATEGHLASLSLESNVKPFTLSDIKYLIVFGDSYSEKIMDNNWTATFLEDKDIKDYNFSVGGAVVDNDIVPREYYDSSFLTQYQSFLNKVPQGKKGDNRNEFDTLFSFWYGTNDVLYFDREKYKFVMKEMYELIADTLCSKLDEIYEMGGRNFLFFKLVDQSVLPYNVNNLDENELKIIKENTQVYNNRLVENAKSFHERHPDTNVFVYASDEELNYILETENYTNNVRNDFIWNDDVHPTKRTFRRITRDLEKLLKVNEKKSFATSGNSMKVTVYIVKMLINISFIIYLLYVN